MMETATSRSMEELMKTQVVDLSNQTVNQALLLNAEIENLRKENQLLKAEKETFEHERDGYIKTIQSIEKELGELQSFDVSKERKLKEELLRVRNNFDSLYDELAEVRAERDELQTKLKEGEVVTMKSERHNGGSFIADRGSEPTAIELRLRQEVRKLKISCDSLFEDLAKVKEERDKLKASLEASQSYHDTSVSGPRSSMFQMTRGTSWRAPNSESNNSSDQASFLLLAVQRQTSAAQSASSDPMTRKLQELEVENLKLKSKIVQLQSQFKEELYKNQQQRQHQQLEQSSSFRNSEHLPRSLSLHLSPRSAGRNRIAGEGDFAISSPLASKGRSLRRSDSSRKMMSPQRSTSLRRIQEYRAKKDPSRESKSDVTESTVATDSETAMTNRDTDPPNVTVNRRPRSFHPSMLPSARLPMTEETAKSPDSLKRNNTADKPEWGRSPSRDLHKAENKAILDSHPAYRASAGSNGSEEQGSMSSLSDSGSTEPVKRSQSLIGRIFGAS